MKTIETDLGIIIYRKKKHFTFYTRFAPVAIDPSLTEIEEFDNSFMLSDRDSPAISFTLKEGKKFVVYSKYPLQGDLNYDESVTLYLGKCVDTNQEYFFDLSEPQAMSYQEYKEAFSDFGPPAFKKAKKRTKKLVHKLSHKDYLYIFDL